MKKLPISVRIHEALRDVPDFPAPGVVFKDITPVLKDPALCTAVVDAFLQRLGGASIEFVAGIESRGFLFGMLLANRLEVPFVPIRKQGKLPYHTLAQSYALEYGQATIEIHEDAIPRGAKVLLHDDLLATGGTVRAASELIGRLGGEITAYTFLVDLEFLGGRATLSLPAADVVALLTYEEGNQVRPE